jgi:hypothetical protein
MLRSPQFLQLSISQLICFDKAFSSQGKVIGFVLLSPRPLELTGFTESVCE